jgi:hypothetical protein
MKPLVPESFLWGNGIFIEGTDRLVAAGKKDWVFDL